jgi:hypothetical protein
LSPATFSGIDARPDGVDRQVAPSVPADTSTEAPNVDPPYRGGLGD